MNTYCVTFFNEFENEIEILKHTFTDAINQANELIKFIERKIKELYKWLKTYIFESVSDEIYFFKELKPKLTSKLIFYKSVLKLESNLPVNKKLKIKYFEKSLNKIYQHSRKNRDFYQYYRSRAIYNDEQYFTRNFEKTKINDYYFELNYDVQLCTSHDYKTAIIISNDLFSSFLENKLEKISKSCSLEHPFLQSNLNWTGNKIDLIELIYALHHQKVINGGNIEIKELAAHFGKVFNIHLEDNIYRSYMDIKSRKNIKTKFLNNLSENFNAKITEEEN